MKISNHRQALTELVKVMTHKTGQGYKIRGLLYSLWNGHPASLLNVMSLDHDLRFALCGVILAFGSHDNTGEFFYDAIKDEIKKQGGPALFDWFCEAGEPVTAEGVAA